MKNRIWLYVGVLVVCMGIIAFISIKLTTKDYEKLISEKQRQIETLQQQSDEYAAKMQEYKDKAHALTQEIVRSSNRINAIRKDIQRQKLMPINPPETTEEIVRRLKEAGFDPKVECK
jgi:septal ring factor EnvC (AmiA/AmiB activator)